MVDFLNANLCGASPELNDILSKLSTAKTEIINKLDGVASEAVASFGEAQNELNSLTDKLQAIEIPTLPKLNLQSELKGIASLIPGSPAAIQSLAKIKSEFGSDLIAKGLELGSLVTDAAAAISGGGDVCALVGNLEKTAGSTGPAVEKAPKVLQAAEPAVSERVSVAWQNPDVEEKVKENDEKVAAHAVTSTPPTKDSGAFKVVPKSDVKEISTPSGSAVKVAPSGTGNNTSPNAGFQHKSSPISEYIKFDRVRVMGGGQIMVITEHPPVEVLSVMLHPPTTYDLLIAPTAEEKAAIAASRGSRGSKWRGGPHYKTADGPHMVQVYWRRGRSKMRAALGKLYPVKVKIDPNLNFGVMVWPPFIPVGDHPGNIVSVYSESWDGKAWVQKPGYFRKYGSGIGSDKSRNKRFGGFAAKVRYRYLENYDPAVDPAPSEEPPEKSVSLREEWAADDRKEKKELAEEAKKKADAEAYAKTPKGIAEEAEERKAAALEKKDTDDFHREEDARIADLKKSNPGLFTKEQLAE